MPINWVMVKNPANGAISEMSEKAFKKTFEEKGFEIVSEERLSSVSGRDPALVAQRSETSEPDEVEEQAADDETPEEDASTSSRRSRGSNEDE